MDGGLSSGSHKPKQTPRSLMTPPKMDHDETRLSGQTQWISTVVSKFPESCPKMDHDETRSSGQTQWITRQTHQVFVGCQISLHRTRVLKLLVGSPKNEAWKIPFFCNIFCLCTCLLSVCLLTASLFIYLPIDCLSVCMFACLQPSQQMRFLVALLLTSSLL